MKRLITMVCCSSLLLLVSCSTPAQTTSPNNLNGAFATVYLNEGDTLSGKVSLNNEVLIERNVSVVQPNGASQQLHLLDIKGYEKEGQFYELKHTGNHLHPRSGFYFMKKLTPEGAALQLFENLERKQKGKSMNEVVYTPVYYLQLPGEKAHRVYPVFGKKFTPHFHKKMSAMVSDCPALAQKILQKEKGYFLSRLDATEQQRKDVLLRIIGEYQNCTGR